MSPWGDKEAIDWPDPQNDGSTPLILAAAQGKYLSIFIPNAFLMMKTELLLTTLLNHSASVFVMNAQGNTALYEASKQGHLNLVLALLRAGSDVDAANKFGNTPLSASVRNSRFPALILNIIN